MNFLGKLFQLRVSLIGAGKVTVKLYGKPQASFKLLEVSVALLSFGIRIVVKI